MKNSASIFIVPTRQYQILALTEKNGLKNQSWIAVKSNNAFLLP